MNVSSHAHIKVSIQNLGLKSKLLTCNVVNRNHDYFYFFELYVFALCDI